MDLNESVVLGGKLVGIALVAATAAKVFMFLCEFIGRRIDGRQDRLDAQQASIDGKIGSRLHHLEAYAARADFRMQGFEEAIGLLIDEVRVLDPSNPKLTEVAAILRRPYPVDLNTPPDMTASLGKIS